MDLCMFLVGPEWLKKPLDQLLQPPDRIMFHVLVKDLACAFR